MQSDAGAPGPPLREVQRSAPRTGGMLTEASGLAVASADAAVLWSIDDSGHEPMLHAIDTSGVSRGATRVTGARNRDWEALAAGPCPAGRCLYVGDIGDNDENEPAVVVWRVAEPTPGAAATSNAESLTFTWDGGPVDVEAMWVGPDTTLWFVSKRPRRGRDSTWRPVRVFALPASAWRERGAARAEVRDSLPIVPRKKRPSLWPTDAALSPPNAEGIRRLAVRTYAEVFVFDTDIRTGRPGVLRAQCSLAALREVQGEGMTWLDATWLAFISEGRATPLQRGICR